ncbi:TetR family transcriptional regulator [Actinomadura sp. KC345]|jgi:AcrR family transcriptional regulator|uniref:TetR/AcrR family transcriptional regulator n=1 Tax=Actinomadura sp. KC345 TaxID=2530371 RepID=UPI00104B7D8E|nr:TetR/AcrR family transcriptional regulator [Actinomadura sp. KC345]TDC55490.1 TetR family transcriptional regulator [Actinomadura sp. KC345]
MAVVRPAHRPSRREELLDAALDELMSDGQYDVAISQIAKRAGMTSAAVYYHFDSREELLEALRDRIERSLQDVVTAQKDEAAIEDWVDGVINRAADWIRRSPKEARFLFVANQLSRGADEEPEVSPWEPAVRVMAGEVSRRDPDLGRLDATMRAMALLALLAELAAKALEGSDKPPAAFGTDVHAAHLVGRRILLS